MRIKQSSGSSTEYCYIDNIEVSYDETWTPEVLLGDVDDDGKISIADVVTLIDYLLYGDESLLNMDAADVDQDGGITIADVTELIDMLLSRE